MNETPPRVLDVYLVAGEESGDQLGFKLMRALREATGGAVAFRGVGGRAMEEEGLQSLFPMSDVAVMGFLPVIRRLPQLLARIRQVADDIIASPPDVLVIIDSPDFTHRVAKRVRAALPHLPVVDYVSPTVWAWRPGRAPRMRAYVDHLLALLPFEPEAHQRLGGPPCTYVGHPLIERTAEMRPPADNPGLRDASPPTLLVLPGSRRSEIERLSDDFGGAVACGCCVRPGRNCSPRRRASGKPYSRQNQPMAAPAADRYRGSGKVRCVSTRPGRAGRIGHRDAGTGAGADPDGCRLQDFAD